MKKSLKTGLFALAGVIAISGTALLVAGCGDDETSSQPTSHIVSCQDVYVDGDRWVDLSSTSVLVQTGQNVVVEAETEPFVVVDKVFANGVECIKNQDGTFSFTMPEEDVTVTATYKDAPEILSARYDMAWILSPSQIAMAEEGAQQGSYYAQQKFSVTFGSRSHFNNKDQNGNMAGVEIFSTNESVIPNESLIGVKSDSVTYAATAYFNVDLTNINPGTTTLVFIDDYDRVLSKTVTVVGYGEAEPENLRKVQLTVDLSGISEQQKDCSFRVWFSEDNSDAYIQGSVYPSVQWKDFVWADLIDGQKTFEFYYTPDHVFSIDAGYAETPEGMYYSFDIQGGADENGIISFSEDENLKVVEFVS